MPIKTIRMMITARVAGILRAVIKVIAGPMRNDSSQAIINGRCNSYTATNCLALYPANDEFGAFAAGVDYIGEPEEKLFTSREIVDRNEFIETGSTGDIYFAKQERWTRDRVHIVKIGFEQIDNPRQALSIIREIQEADQSVNQSYSKT